jgi:hypothetical protein
MQLVLEAEIEREGREHDGYVSEEIGECLLLLGEKDKARPHFRQAYQLLSKDEWFVANETKRLARMKKLGGIEHE